MKAKTMSLNASSSRTQGGSSGGLSGSVSGPIEQTIKGEYELKKLKTQYNLENALRWGDTDRTRDTFKWFHSPDYTGSRQTPKDTTDTKYFKANPTLFKAVRHRLPSNVQEGDYFGVNRKDKSITKWTPKLRGGPSPFSLETKNIVDRLTKTTEVDTKALVERTTKLTQIGLDAKKAEQQNTFDVYKKNGVEPYLLAAGGGGMRSAPRHVQHLGGLNYRSVPLGDNSKFTGSVAQLTLGLGNL